MMSNMQHVVNSYMDGKLREEYHRLVAVRRHQDLPYDLVGYTKRCVYNSKWDEITRLCRGVILHIETGEVIAHPFPKFFNLGERNETKPENLPKEPFEVFEKVDGSLGISYRDPGGEMFLATRGRFDSEQAVRGTQFLRNTKAEKVTPKEVTLLFEILYPGMEGPVIPIDREELVLLGAVNRHNGVELSSLEVDALAREIGVRSPHRYTFSCIEEMVAQSREIPETLEGWVIRFQSGLRVKLKGDAYTRLTRAKLDLSPRRVRIAYLENAIQKLKEEHYPEELWGEIDATVAAFDARVAAFRQQAERVRSQLPPGLKGKELFTRSGHLADGDKALQGGVLSLYRGAPFDWKKAAIKESD